MGHNYNFNLPATVNPQNANTTVRVSLVNTIVTVFRRCLLRIEF